MNKDASQKVALFLFTLLVVISTSSYILKAIQQEEKQILAVEKELLHQLDIAICGDVARLRDPKNDPMSAQIAIGIGNSLLKSRDPDLRARGTKYLEMGMCLDLNILKNHLKKQRVSGI